MRGQQVLVLLIVLVAPAAAFQITVPNSQQVIEDPLHAVAINTQLDNNDVEKLPVVKKDGRWTKLRKWFKGSAEELVDSAEELVTNPVEGTNSKWRNRAIKGSYRFSALLDVAIYSLNQASLVYNNMSSTSTYGILATSEPCRNHFRTALTEVDNEVPFKAATKCITDDMDAFAAIIFDLDSASNGLSMIQSLLNTFMTYKEFTHSLSEIEKGQAEAKDVADSTQSKLDALNIDALTRHSEKEMTRLIQLMCEAKLIDTEGTCEATLKKLQQKLDEAGTSKQLADAAL